MSIFHSNIGIVIQARVGSSRLPNKMLLPFYEGKSILEILIERFKNECNQHPFILATTVNKADNEIQGLCEKENIDFFRGSEDDVLIRFIEAAEKFKFDYIIRVCADNPLFDIQGTLNLVEHADRSHFDYFGYQVFGKPSILSHLGFWGELVSLNALKKAHDLSPGMFYKEHVTNYIYGNPKVFKVKLINSPATDLIEAEIRLTVDTQEDFDLMKNIYSKLAEFKVDIAPNAILRCISSNPDFKKVMKAQIKMNKK